MISTVKITPNESSPGQFVKKGDDEIDREARLLVRQHGSRAAIVAADELNRCIDRRDWDGRDLWARIVRRIHELSPQ